MVLQGSSSAHPPRGHFTQGSPKGRGMSPQTPLLQRLERGRGPAGHCGDRLGFPRLSWSENIPSSNQHRLNAVGDVGGHQCTLARPPSTARLCPHAGLEPPLASSPGNGDAGGVLEPPS